MVEIDSFRADSAIDIESYLQAKYDNYKNVEVLGITTFAGRLTVFVKQEKAE